MKPLVINLLGVILIVLGVVLLANQIRLEVVASYNYEKTYLQLWELADKSSTIPAKEKFIVSFVETLKHGKAEGQFAENDAVWLKTPNNNFDANLAAVETLAQRLKEIQAMDPKTFEYNTAIQQITAQEQGQASHLMGVFKGCYELQNYWAIWGWIDGVLVITELLVLIGGIVLVCLFYDGY